MEVYVVGKQWMWKAQHETGQREINELHVPVGRNIKLTMTTEDVLHDFSIPAFRTKADVVPGRYTYIWFNADKAGQISSVLCRILRAQSLGNGRMGLRDGAEQILTTGLQGMSRDRRRSRKGRDLFQNKLGCASCHAGGPAAARSKLENVFSKDVKLVGGTNRQSRR